MKPITLLDTRVRMKHGKTDNRGRKVRSHRCERRKLKALMSRWDPELDDLPE